MILAEWLLLGLVSLHGSGRRWEAAGFALAAGLSDGSKIRLGVDETEDTHGRDPSEQLWAFERAN